MRAFALQAHASYILIALCLVAYAATACRTEERAGQEVALTWRSEPTPIRVGEVTIVLELADSAGNPISGSELGIEASMTHPGMLPVGAFVEEEEPGVYRCNLAVSMPGDWYIVVSGRLPDGTHLEREIQFPVIAAGR